MIAFYFRLNMIFSHTFRDNIDTQLARPTSDIFFSEKYPTWDHFFVIYVSLVSVCAASGFFFFSFIFLFIRKNQTFDVANCSKSRK